LHALLLLCYFHHKHAHVLVEHRLLFITTRCSIRSSTSAAALCWNQSLALFKRRRRFSRWEMKHFLARTLTTSSQTSVHLYRGLLVIIVVSFYYVFHGFVCFFLLRISRFCPFVNAVFWYFVTHVKSFLIHLYAEERARRF